MKHYKSPKCYENSFISKIDFDNAITVEIAAFDFQISIFDSSLLRDPAYVDPNFPISKSTKFRFYLDLKSLWKTLKVDQPGIGGLEIKEAGYLAKFGPGQL